MLQKLQKRRDEGGFTIIEVLIVLAIAGLIMLIVFLAVPALQRSQRNTSRKNDASRIADATTEFVSNNDGTVPASTTDLTTILNSAGKLGQYTLTASGSVAVNTISVTSTATQSALSGQDEVRLVTGATCGTSGATVSGTSRQIALQYTIETTGGLYTGNCLSAN